MFMRGENDFKIRFTNQNFCKEEFLYNRFNVFIKNIGPDSRSKIRNYSTKLRIVDFLRDIENTLINNNYSNTVVNEHVKIKKM